MKINEIHPVRAVNHAYKKSDEHLRKEGRTAKRKDEVYISAEAKELLGIQNKHKSDPASQKRLEELKQSVSAGTYHVDARKIAEKLFPYLK